MAIKVPIVSTYDNKGIVQADGALKKFGFTSQAQFTKVAGGFGLAAAAGTQMFLSLDAGYDAIIAGTGATGVALDGLKESAGNVAREVPNSFAEVGAAIGEVNTRLGLTGEPLEEMTTKFLNLARVTKTDVTEAIGEVTRVFGDWGVESDDQSLALDKLFLITQETGIEIGELAEQVVQFGAPLRQLGFSFEEAAALFGKFEKEGVNTTTVMSGLRMGLKDFAAAGLEPKQAFEDLIVTMQDLGPGIEATTLAADVFGVKAGGDMAAAILEGRFSIDDMVESLGDAEGALDTAAEATLSIQDRMAQLSNIVTVALAPAIMEAADELEGLLEIASVATGAIGSLNTEASKSDPSLLGRGFGLLKDSVELTINPVGALHGAIGDLVDEMKGGEEPADSLGTRIDSVAEAFLAATERVSMYGGGLAAVVDPAVAVREALRRQNEALEANAEEARNAEDALKDLRAENRQMADDAMSAEEAVWDQIEAIERVNEKLADEDATLIDVSRSINDAIRKTDEMVVATEGLTEESLDTADGMLKWNDGMLTAAGTMSGQLKMETLEHIARVNGIPESKITEFKASPDRVAMARVKVELDKLAENRRVNYVPVVSYTGGYSRAAPDGLNVDDLPTRTDRPQPAQPRTIETTVVEPAVFNLNFAGAYFNGTMSDEDVRQLASRIATFTREQL